MSRHHLNQLHQPAILVRGTSTHPVTNISDATLILPCRCIRGSMQRATLFEHSPIDYSVPHIDHSAEACFECTHVLGWHPLVCDAKKLLNLVAQESGDNNRSSKIMRTGRAVRSSMIQAWKPAWSLSTEPTGAPCSSWTRGLDTVFIQLRVLDSSHDQRHKIFINALQPGKLSNATVASEAVRTGHPRRASSRVLETVVPKQCSSGVC